MFFDIHFIPECNADTEFADIILSEYKNRFKHHGSDIRTVSKIMSYDSKSKLQIGFIDNDKYNVPVFFNQFKVIDALDHIQFKKLDSSNKYLFVLNPAIEGFVWQEMNSLSLQALDFDLPKDFKDFTKTLKKKSIKEHQGYLKLIKTLKNKNSQGVTFILDKINAILNTETT